MAGSRRPMLMVIDIPITCHNAPIVLTSGTQHWSPAGNTERGQGTHARGAHRGGHGGRTAEAHKEAVDADGWTKPAQVRRAALQWCVCIHGRPAEEASQSRPRRR